MTTLSKEAEMKHTTAVEELKLNLKRLGEIIDEFVPGFSCPDCAGERSFETGKCENCGGDIEAPNGEATGLIFTIAEALTHLEASVRQEERNKVLQLVSPTIKEASEHSSIYESESAAVKYGVSKGITLFQRKIIELSRKDLECT
jgi:hypothetical protein